MRKLLSLLALLIAPSLAFAQAGAYASPVSGASSVSAVASPIKLVQTSGTFTAYAGATTANQAYPAANTAGDLLLFFVQMSTASSGNTVSVSDSLGNTWLPAGTSDIGIAYIFYVPSAKAGANTVTVTFNASSSGSFSMAEYSGHLVAHPIGNANTPNGSNLFPGGSINNPIPGAALIVTGGNNGGANNYSNFVGCNPRTPAASAVAVWCDNTAISTGLINWSFTQTGGGSPDFIMKAITILPSTYVAGTNPAVVRQAEGGVASSGSINSAAASPVKELFAGGNQTGNVIVLLTQQTSATDNITAVSDSNGNVYTKMAGGGDIADESGHRNYSIYTAPVTSASLNNNTITVTMSAGTAQIAAIEVSGITGVEDVNASGTAAYTLTTSNALNKFIVTNNGHTSSLNFSLLSGFDLFGSTNINMEVNTFTSCSKANAISSYVNAAASFAGSFSIALVPTVTTGSCVAATGSLNNNSQTSHVLVGVGTGTCTASSTLGLFGLGQQVTPTCTSTVTTAGQVITVPMAPTVLNGPSIVQGISVSAGTGGVNGSSGVFTVLKNGAAVTPSMTTTLGTSTFNSDFAHPFQVVMGDVISVQFTTQGADTLANVKVFITVTP